MRENVENNVRGHDGTHDEQVWAKPRVIFALVLLATVTLQTIENDAVGCRRA